MSKKPQSEKFKDLAREAECEDDERAFDEKLGKIAKAPVKYRSKKTPAEKSADGKKRTKKKAK